ncbi:hypothetical protein BC833DRAFT_586617 [Globomyces pollinis-pini]|nr:hypothetical protein BC833DRAFT_586617 [Globomyces pollinis-pini]
MLKSIWGAISGDYKMHLVLEDAMDALPTTGTVSFQSKNIPINVTLKSSSDLNHIRVAYKVSSNQPNTKPPSTMKFTDNDNICSLYFNTKDNKAIGGLVVSVGNINYLPLLIEAIIFIPEKMIPKFKLKIDVGSGTLNTNSLVFESLDGNYTSSITFTDISTRITRLKSRENISLRSCDLGNSFITSEKGTIKLKVYFSINAVEL